MEFKIWESSLTGRLDFQQVSKRKSFKTQYLKKNGVNSRGAFGVQAGLSSWKQTLKKLRENIA